MSLGEAQNFYIPSTRLGSKLRHDAYYLPPITHSTPIPSSAASDRSVPILRKSFRKTLQAVSGFQVRMRTVFVPHIYIPGGDNSDDDIVQEAGSEESTVVLCLEVMNNGESDAGYAIESVGVDVSGEDAKIQLISWGEGGFSDATSIFPLSVRSHERYDILYAVSFMRPAEDDPTSQKSLNDIQACFQRSVSIIISGKPFDISDIKRNETEVSYPTKSFTSRWSCVLDLSPRHDQEYLLSMPEPLPSSRSALPYPPSPFPPPSPQAKLVENYLTVGSNTLVTSDITSKRHTFSGTTSKSVISADSAAHRASMGAMLGTHHGRVSPLPPRRINSPLPHSTLSPPLPALPAGQRSPSRLGSGQPFIDTKAPVLPQNTSGALTPRPYSFAPPPGYPLDFDPRISSLRSAGLSPSPDSRWNNLGFEQATHPEAADLIISVNLLTTRTIAESISSLNAKQIYPLEEFSLELFAFNKSGAIRTYEVTYPERAGYLPKDRRSLLSLSLRIQLGFLPLENNIIIGQVLQVQNCFSFADTRLAVLLLRRHVRPFGCGFWPYVQGYIPWTCWLLETSTLVHR